MTLELIAQALSLFERRHAHTDKHNTQLITLPMPQPLLACTV